MNGRPAVPARRRDAELAVIIVGYKSLSHLKECLPSLADSSYRHFQVIFVDNDPTDGSHAYITAAHPDVICIDPGENLGYAGGNNVGLRLALELGFPYVLLLNPDTVVDKKCLEILMREANPSRVLQPLILLHEDGATDLVNSAGNSLNYLGFSYCGRYGVGADTIEKGTAPITVASGAAVLIPAGILRSVGLLNESFFMYHEDVDLSWRARLAGNGVFLVSAARVWHKYLFSRNQKKLYFAERNRLAFVLMSYGPRMLLVLAPSFLVNEILICGYALMTGWLGTKLLSYVGLVRMLPGLLAERKRITGLRVLSDAQMRDLFSTDIGFAQMEVPLTRLYNFLSRTYWSVAKWLV